MPQSDWALFHDVPIILIELDSSSHEDAQTTGSSKQATDSAGIERNTPEQCRNRGLAQAACVVRSINIALGIHDYVLPFIWVSKTWRAHCDLVYQDGINVCFVSSFSLDDRLTCWFRFMHILSNTRMQSISISRINLAKPISVFDCSISLIRACAH